MPDRTKAPKVREIESLQLPAVHHYELDNGIPVYAVDLGTQDVVKLEVVFRAGRPYEQKRLAARATARQIREGSKRYSAADVAEALDFYGCTLSIPFQLDHSIFSLYSLSKHFAPGLQLLTDLLRQPTFPEKELDAFQLRNQRRLAVDLSKNDVIAYRQVTEEIFGESHPYGYNSQPSTYGALRREDLIAHHQRLYNRQNCCVFLSGRVTKTVMQQVNEAFSRAIPNGPPAYAQVSAPPPQRKTLRIDRPDTLQSALRISRPLFNRQHPDYQGLYVLNTILGGYFGSRLMANIREDKGYTYNIYSSVDTMQYGGQFMIGTEVGQDVVEDSLAQIYLEMERLQQEPVGEAELRMVRNYLLGSFLTLLDGPFNVADVVRTQVLEGLPSNYLEQLAKTVRHISPEELQRLAQKYFNKTEMVEVAVGP